MKIDFIVDLLDNKLWVK